MFSDWDDENNIFECEKVLVSAMWSEVMVGFLLEV